MKERAATSGARAPRSVPLPTMSTVLLSCAPYATVEDTFSDVASARISSSVVPMYLNFSVAMMVREPEFRSG